jgi:hypothetical protein
MRASQSAPLARELQSHKYSWREENDLWRDKLGVLVVDLSQRLSQHVAARRTHHAALVTGNRSTFLNSWDRSARALACRRGAVSEEDPVTPRRPLK